MGKVVDVATRQRKQGVLWHAKLDDLRRGFEVAERFLGHLQRLRCWNCLLSSVWLALSCLTFPSFGILHQPSQQRSHHEDPGNRNR
jgi:hypothetical protein